MKYIKTILNLSEEVLAEIIANPQASEKVAQMGKHGKNREQFVLEVRQYMVQRCSLNPLGIGEGFEHKKFIQGAGYTVLIP